jgi:hypothetical protein
MLETFLVVLGLSAVGVVALARKIQPYKGLHADLRGHRVQMLERVAQPRGATLVEDRGLVLELHGLRIVAELSLREGHAASGTIFVELPAPGTAEFQVYPEGFASAASKALGGRDVELGVVPAFDHAFMLKGRDELLLRRLWTAQRCTAMVELGNATLTSSGTRIELALLDPPITHTLGVAIDLVLDVALEDVFGLAALRALPDATASELGVAIAGPGSIRIAAERDGDRHVTRARAVAPSLQAVTIDLASPPEARPLADLPGNARSFARMLGPARIESLDGELAITWPTIEADRRRLAAAIELLRACVLAPGGMFR